MRFSEYILNDSLDEGIKDKIKDTAIKAGRKLGIKKARDAETSGEKKDRETAEKTALENRRKSTIKAKKIMKDFIHKEFSKYAKDGSTLRVADQEQTPDEGKFCLRVVIPKNMGSKDNLFKAIGNVFKKCEQSNIYLIKRWDYDGYVYFAFSAPSNPAMIRD